MSDKSNEGVIGGIRGRYAARLGLALLVAVALLLVLGLAVNAQTTSQVREDARANLESSAAIQSDEVKEWVEGNRRQVRTTARLPVLQSENHSEISGELGELVEREYVSDEVVAIHVVDEDDERIIASSRPDEFVGKNLAEMVEMDDPYVSKPFHVPAFDFPVVAMTARVPDENRLVVFMINPTSEISDLRQPVESGRTYVVTEDGSPVAAPNNASLSGPATDRAIANALAGDTGVVTREDGSLIGYASIGSTDWVVLTHVERSEAFAMIDTVRTGVGAMILVALLTLGLVGLTVGRNTATALRSLADDARDLGEGDLEVTFDVDRPDEIGTLARTLAETRDALRARIDEVERMNRHLESTAESYRDVMRAAAAGDFTRRMTYDGENEAMAEIAVEFNQMLDEIETATTELQQFAHEVVTASEAVTTSSDEVKRASDQVSRSIQQIADGADRQNGQLQAIASEMNDLSATTQESAAAANEVADLAQRTTEVGQEGREAAQAAIEGMQVIEAETDATVDAIERLEDEVEQIDDLLELISDVARRTNMLALNANVEASRLTGESDTADDGVGFAAVADQIKELATGANQAAKKIEDRLDRIKSEAATTVEEVETTNTRVSEHTDAVAAAVDALEEIATYAEETNNGIQEISAATEQQAATTQEVVAMTDEVAAIAEQTAEESETVTAAAEEQTATLTEVSEQATELSTRADELQTLLANFEVEQAPGGIDADGDTSSLDAPVPDEE